MIPKPMNPEGPSGTNKESWYPESCDEGEGTKETMSLTSYSASTYHSSHYLDAVKLRVQMYDSYRLARIILGIPIKSFNESSNSKAIFEAIKVVAEMKMELVQLQGKVKQLEVDSGPVEISGNQFRSKTSQKHTVSDQNELIKDYNDQMILLNDSQSRVFGILSDLMDLDDGRIAGDATIPNECKTKILGGIKGAIREAKESTEISRELIARVNHVFERTQEQSSNYRREIEKLQRQIQTKSTIHQIELESFRTKHAQQAMDLCFQLEAYKEQVENQHDEMLRMQERYHELEVLAVTPKQAHEVLQAINKISEYSSIEEQMEVQSQVVEVLQRMSQMYTKQVHDEAELQAILEAARRKEQRSHEELQDLKLQEKMLLEETRIPAGDWRVALAAQRTLCERQISDILSREESRLLEMEVLELKLTELAFSAVEIEDLRDDIERSRDEYENKMTKINSFAVGTESSLARLRHQVEEIMENQKESIQILKPLNPAGQKWKALLDRKSTIDRLNQLEKELLDQNEELCSMKEELSNNKAKIQLLEHKLSMAKGTKE